MISVGDDVVYAKNSTTVTVNVSRISTEITGIDYSMELIVGVNGTFNAVLSPSDAGVLSYLSNDTEIISVSSSGNFTACSLGTAIVTVLFAGNDKYAPCEANITVTVKESTIITLENDTFYLKANDIVSAGAVLTPAEAGNLTYTSSNESVVKIENTTIVAVGAGYAVVTVSFEGSEKYAPCEANITVNVALNDASVSVNSSTLDLSVVDTFTIVADTNPSGLSVTFIPDNSGVVSVDDSGIVTALKEGTAVIIVSVGDDVVYAKNSTKVTVTVSKIATNIDSSSISAVYNINKYRVIDLMTIKLA